MAPAPADGEHVVMERQLEIGNFNSGDRGLDDERGWGFKNVHGQFTFVSAWIASHAREFFRRKEKVFAVSVSFYLGGKRHGIEGKFAARTVRQLYIRK